ncbi:hypothetical protein GXM_05663 [Nostoc sphaeroides CCNUC1]|uniref:Uncharacterized protein n=1 Tax=Nostoc sphaeroides CCNUC1 TaxID=2653204 RepID=A0A5P8W6P0_9NOSO|nr:hypothetical protein GXM_05663 [Nostoc sphaeroides CCNUC1]
MYPKVGRNPTPSVGLDSIANCELRIGFILPPAPCSLASSTPYSPSTQLTSVRTP